VPFCAGAYEGRETCIQCALLRGKEGSAAEQGKEETRGAKMDHVRRSRNSGGGEKKHGGGGKGYRKGALTQRRRRHRAEPEGFATPREIPWEIAEKEGTHRPTASNHESVARKMNRQKGKQAFRCRPKETKTPVWRARQGGQLGKRSSSPKKGKRGASLST